MRVAIVDDSVQDAAQLSEYLTRFQSESGIMTETVSYSDARAFLSDCCNWDLVILDIDMPGMNGVEAARLLRKTDSNVVLMFVTNMPQYTLCGYEVEAVDYVLKPVSYPDFALKLRKAGRYILRNRDERMSLHTADGVVSLSVREILYVESMLHYLVYHTVCQDYRVRGTMGAAEAELESHQFARCNASYLVNLRYVEAIEKEDVLVAGVRLRMSRGKRSTFLNRFTQFLGGMKQ
ncbi:MAG: LytR/AlgR family response regulator transcription factor [Candidatus Onthomonas sp.]